MPDPTTLTMYANNITELSVILIVEPEGHETKISEPLNEWSYRIVTVPEAPSYKIWMNGEITTTTHPNVIATFTGTGNGVQLTSRQEH